MPSIRPTAPRRLRAGVAGRLSRRHRERRGDRSGRRPDDAGAPPLPGCRRRRRDRRRHRHVPDLRNQLSAARQPHQFGERGPFRGGQLRLCGRPDEIDRHRQHSARLRQLRRQGRLCRDDRAVEPGRQLRDVDHRPEARRQGPLRRQGPADADRGSRPVADRVRSRLAQRQRVGHREATPAFASNRQAPRP